MLKNSRLSKTHELKFKDFKDRPCFQRLSRPSIYRKKIPGLSSNFKVA